MVGTIYPAGIDNPTSLPSFQDGITGVNATTLNRLQQAVIAIEAQLGILPAGTYGSVRARLDALTAGLNTFTSVQNGFNYGKFLLIPIFSVIPSTNSTTFVNAGTFEFDPTTITGAGTGSQKITLRVIAHTTNPIMSIQLFNITSSAVVPGTSMTTSSSVPVLLTTGDLSTNITQGYGVYQVQIKMAAGANTDQIVLDMASFRIDWS